MEILQLAIVNENTENIVDIDRMNDDYDMVSGVPVLVDAERTEVTACSCSNDGSCI